LVNEESLEAHLDHGDGFAPESVQTAADCLVPQAPPEAVSVSTITDSDGKARIAIPQSNVVARATVADETGNALAGIDVDLIVEGDDYLALARDPESRFQPQVLTGSILDARPGSALTVALRFVKKACTHGLVSNR
jgi:hypothetical protein